MFVESAELYDAIYHFKNYARECERLRGLIGEAVPAASTLLWQVRRSTRKWCSRSSRNFVVARISLRRARCASRRSVAVTYVRIKPRARLCAHKTPRAFTCA